LCAIHIVDENILPLERPVPTAFDGIGLFDKDIPGEAGVPRLLRLGVDSGGA